MDYFYPYSPHYFIAVIIPNDSVDQMATLFVQYLAIYYKEILPKTYVFYQSRLNILPSTKYTLKKLTQSI